MTSAAGAPRRPQFGPISNQGWSNLETFRRQGLAYLKDPKSNPEPDITLLLGELHGPIHSLTPGHFGGDRVVFLQVQNLSYPPEPLLPEVLLLARCGIAFGGSLFVNPNGNGRSYLSLFRGDDTTSLARLVANARGGEVVKHRYPSAPNYRPEALFKVSLQDVRNGEGRPMRAADKGRSHMIAVAVAQYHRTHAGSGIEVTARQYQRILRDCFKLIDGLAALRRDRGVTLPDTPPGRPSDPEAAAIFDEFAKALDEVLG